MSEVARKLDLEFDTLSLSGRDACKPVLCAIRVRHDKVPSLDGYRATVSAIILPSGEIYTGVSVAAPGEQFSFTKGRQKSLGLAYQSFLHDGLPEATVKLDGETAEQDIDNVLLGQLAAEKQYARECHITLINTKVATLYRKIGVLEKEKAACRLAGEQ